MTYDDLLNKIGNFGKYQKRIYFFLCLPALSCALHSFSGVFILSKTDHRYTISTTCNVPSIYIYGYSLLINLVLSLCIYAFTYICVLYYIYTISNLFLYFIILILYIQFLMLFFR